MKMNNIYAHDESLQVKTDLKDPTWTISSENMK